MQNKEFLTQLRIELNHFIVDIVNAEEVRLQKTEAMVCSINRELSQVTEELHLIRSVINEQWELDAIKAKQNKVREILINIERLSNPESLITHHYLAYMETEEYKNWANSKGIEDPIIDARKGELLSILKYIKDDLVNIFEIKDVEDFMI